MAGPAQTEAGFGQEGQTRRSNLQFLLLLFTLLICMHYLKDDCKEECMHNQLSGSERKREAINQQAHS